MDINVNKPVHLGYTYSLMEIKCLRDKVYHDNCYRTLLVQTCKEVRDLNICKRRQGCRSGAKSRKQQNPRYADLSNLSNIKTSNKSDSNYLEVRIATVNVQSVTNKDLVLHHHMCDNRIDLCVLTETWLSSNPDDRTLQSCTPLNSCPFRISISNRTGQSGGGLAPVDSKEINVTKVSDEIKWTFQNAIWKMTTNKFNATIIELYHPLYSVVNQITNAQCLEEFLNWLPDQIIEHKILIITGDINLNLNKLEDHDGSTFLDNLDVLGLELHCRFVTHKLSNTLDVFLTEISSDITIHSCKPGPFISNHCMMECTTSMPHKDIIQKSVTFIKIKDIKVVQFTNDVEKHLLFNSEGHTDDVDTLIANLETAFWEALDSHAPEKSKLITCRPKCP